MFLNKQNKSVCEVAKIRLMCICYNCISCFHTSMEASISYVLWENLLIFAE